MTNQDESTIIVGQILEEIVSTVIQRVQPEAKVEIDKKKQWISKIIFAESMSSYNTIFWKNFWFIKYKHLCQLQMAVLQNKHYWNKSYLNG